jgi:hypothetical protein
MAIDLQREHAAHSRQLAARHAEEGDQAPAPLPADDAPRVARQASRSSDVRDAN